MSEKKGSGSFTGIVAGSRSYSSDAAEMTPGNAVHCGLCGSTAALLIMPMGAKSDPYGYSTVCPECAKVKGYHLLLKRATFESLRAAEAIAKVGQNIRAFENLRNLHLERKKGGSSER